MLENQVQSTVDSLKQTRKAVITLGCSFVQGQGSINTEIVDKYPFKLNQSNTMCFAGNDDQIKEVLDSYPILSYHPSPENPIDFTSMEFENSFTSALCRRYLKDYTPINFGMKGNGNRASVMQLFRFPEIDYSELDDIIVMFFPTGMDRYDMAAREFNEHFSHKSIWPHYDKNATSIDGKLWNAYSMAVWSEGHMLMEYLYTTEILRTWCKLHNAKLFIMPGFDSYYRTDDPIGFYQKHVPPMQELRDDNTDLNDRFRIQRENNARKRVNEMFANHPWDNYIEIKGNWSLASLVQYTETSSIPDKFFQYFFEHLGKGSPNGYWSICSHPSKKGHEAIAKHIYEHLRDVEGVVV